MRCDKKVKDLIIKYYKDGVLLKDICNILNSQGIKTETGCDFQTSTISYIANNSGLRRTSVKVYKNKNKRRVLNPAIKSDSFLDTMQEILTSNLRDDLKTTLMKGLLK